jgi:hypothetical protein
MSAVINKSSTDLKVMVSGSADAKDAVAINIDTDINI